MTEQAVALQPWPGNMLRHGFVTVAPERESKSYSARISHVMSQEISRRVDDLRSYR